MSSRRNKELSIPLWRYLLIVALLGLLAIFALGHIAGLQVVSGSDRGFKFLQDQGDARMVRTETIPAYRGLITDRRGEPLAVSTPVVSIWANPQVIETDTDAFLALTRDLNVDANQLRERISRYRNKEFMYLARHLMPLDAEKILAHKVPGVHGQQEYRRFYPAGEVAAQVVGFTNIDDQGQEGVELAYERSLVGQPGAKRVIKDRRGQVIKEIGLIDSGRPGRDIALSIDLRLQYLAYRELKAAVSKFRAAAGALVMLDVETGEVLAMVNQPSYNPNNRVGMDIAGLRNRVITDLVEPGSTMKPLTVAAALESGKYTKDSIFDTSPGYIWVSGKTFSDHTNYGVLDMTGVLRKSSQVATTKMALDLEPSDVRDMFARFGMGEAPGTGFPGESPGVLPEYRKWRTMERITMAFGYGMSGTPLQVARAYSVLANDGVKKPVSLLKLDKAPEGEQILDPQIARDIREMMVSVTEPGGTGTRAAIAGYTVAGKTGTSHKVGARGYEARRYVGLFAGMVPADNPKLVTVVVIDDPQGKDYYGGLVAAPVFSKVSADALRLLRVPPDVQPESQMAETIQVPLRGERS
ncbi:MAG: penicillin-binding transpeptidase domain-containing protein [Pseudomonas sp.]